MNEKDESVMVDSSMGMTHGLIKVITEVHNPIETNKGLLADCDDDELEDSHRLTNLAGDQMCVAAFAG